MLFKKKIVRYIDAETGRRVTSTTPGAKRIVEKSSKWYCRIRLPDGRLIERPAYSSKEASKQLESRLLREAEEGAEGINVYAESGGRPLAEHIADWKATLEARNRSPKHVHKLTSYATRVAAECRWKYLRDLSADGAERHLAERREAGLSTSASNDHVAAMVNFGNWLIKSRPKRWPANPFSGIGKLNADDDTRLVRRPATPEELQRLIEAARNGEPFRGISGCDRAMIYRVATETGFRAAELASLTTASLSLDSDVPTVTVQAGYSKRGTTDVQPIRKELADELKVWLEERQDRSEFVRLPSAESKRCGPALGSRKPPGCSGAIWGPPERNGSRKARRRPNERTGSDPRS